MFWTEKLIEKLLATNSYNIQNKSVTARNECILSFELKSIEWIYSFVKSCLLMVLTLEKSLSFISQIAGRLMQVVAHCPWTVLLLALSQNFGWRLLLSSCPSVCLSVRKQWPCEHTQGYNSTIRPGKMAQLDLEKSPISPFININQGSLWTHSRLKFFTDRNYIWHTYSMGANKGWDCKWAISDGGKWPNWT